MKGFEEKLGHLEKLAEQIRDRDVPLEEAMALFDEGVVLSKNLEEELEGFERKVEILSNEPPQDGSGEAELSPF
ncbi:MAG: exodeoxyribonuclease VII small subunit [Spirochaetes bacterium]|nr:MAG: exodeoxyribonuclease VII small subunit [Spirochaetota bacterium]RKX83551.1 MAG: exodeoxyribonuclease VII small subunit [Spirochaetota bacterium]RKX98736.1 MAG: exodeoxyribonuclease VII small subunit [Spirochaetota bacterium]